MTSTGNMFLEDIMAGVRGAKKHLPEIGETLSEMLDIAEPLNKRFAAFFDRTTDEMVRRKKELAEIAIEMTRASVPVEVMLRFFPAPEPEDGHLEQRVLEKIVPLVVGFISKSVGVTPKEDQYPDDPYDGMILTIKVGGTPTTISVGKDCTMEKIIESLADSLEYAKWPTQFYLVDEFGVHLPRLATLAQVASWGARPVELKMEAVDAETEEEPA